MLYPGDRASYRTPEEALWKSTRKRAGAAIHAMIALLSHEKSNLSASFSPGGGVPTSALYPHSLHRKLILFPLPLPPPLLVGGGFPGYDTLQIDPAPEHSGEHRCKQELS